MLRIITKYSFIILFLYNYTYSSEKCQDFSILNNGEPVVSFGMDTTYNWWAVTQPFTDRYRIIINGNESDSYLRIFTPNFSANGDNYAYFAENQSIFSLITHSKGYSSSNNNSDINNIYNINNEKVVNLITNNFGVIKYSGNSKILAYSYQINNLTEIKIVNSNNPNNVINEFKNLIGVNKDFVIDYEGYNIAYIAERGGLKNLYMNNIELGYFDDIKIFGFWEDGSLYYASRNGNIWRVNKNKEVIVDNLVFVQDGQVNLFGTYIAFVGTSPNGQQNLYSYYDDLYEPLMSKPFEVISNMVLNPITYLTAFRAKYSLNELVVLSLTTYASSPTATPPQFTFEGSELFYSYCDNNCFFSVNGKNYRLKNNIDVMTKLVKKPYSESFAYVSNIGLFVYDLFTEVIYSGMMVDYIIPPRYNRFEDRYESIGMINNRLYLLTCKF